mmetsp:Transcript_31162/g.73996  ORF Transcript_31162/g.73996 Transcript_31162/m.73996 type:complete len:327 (-) Transcript_31162:611-1591(-)
MSAADERRSPRWSCALGMPACWFCPPACRCPCCCCWSRGNVNPAPAIEKAFSPSIEPRVLSNDCTFSDPSRPPPPPIGYAAPGCWLTPPRGRAPPACCPPICPCMISAAPRPCCCRSCWKLFSSPPCPPITPAWIPPPCPALTRSERDVKDERFPEMEEKGDMKPVIDPRFDWCCAWSLPIWPGAPVDWGKPCGTCCASWGTPVGMFWPPPVPKFIPLLPCWAPPCIMPAPPPPPCIMPGPPPPPLIPDSCTIQSTIEDLPPSLPSAPPARPWPGISSPRRRDSPPPSPPPGCCWMAWHAFMTTHARREILSSIAVCRCCAFCTSW